MPGWCSLRGLWCAGPMATAKFGATTLTLRGAPAGRQWLSPAAIPRPLRRCRPFMPVGCASSGEPLLQHQNGFARLCRAKLFRLLSYPTVVTTCRLMAEQRASPPKNIAQNSGNRIPARRAYGSETTRLPQRALMPLEKSSLGSHDGRAAEFAVVASVD